MPSSFETIIDPYIVTYRHEGTERQDQRAELFKDNYVVVQALLHLDRKEYETDWVTHLSPDEFVEFVEAALKYYELSHQYTPYPHELQIMYAVYDPALPEGDGLVEHIPYHRPLNWELIQAHIGQHDLISLFFDTPLGTFWYAWEEGTLKCGIISSVMQLDGFAEFVEATSKKEVDKENAEKFFNAMVALFNSQL